MLEDGSNFYHFALFDKNRTKVFLNTGVIINEVMGTTLPRKLINPARFQNSVIFLIFIVSGSSGFLRKYIFYKKLV